MIKRTNTSDIATDIIALKSVLKNGVISIHCTPVDLATLVEKNINWWSEIHNADVDESLRGSLAGCPVYTDLDPTDCNSYLLVGVSTNVIAERSFRNYIQPVIDAEVKSADIVDIKVSKKLRDCFISVIGELDTASIIDNNASPGVLDSLDEIEVIIAIEEAYSIEICDEDASKFKTVADIMRYLHVKGCEA